MRAMANSRCEKSRRPGDSRADDELARVGSTQEPPAPPSPEGDLRLGSYDAPAPSLPAIEPPAGRAAFPWGFRVTKVIWGAVARPHRRPAFRPHGRCRLQAEASPEAPSGRANGNYRHGYFTRDAIARRRQLN